MLSFLLPGFSLISKKAAIWPQQQAIHFCSYIFSTALKVTSNLFALVYFLYLQFFLACTPECLQSMMYFFVAFSMQEIYLFSLYPFERNLSTQQNLVPDQMHPAKRNTLNLLGGVPRSGTERGHLVTVVPQENSKKKFVSSFQLCR